MKKISVAARARFRVMFKGNEFIHELVLLPPAEGESHYGNGTYVAHYSQHASDWDEVEYLDTRYVIGITKDFTKWATDYITAWANPKCKIELIEAEG